VPSLPQVTQLEQDAILDFEHRNVGAFILVPLPYLGWVPIIWTFLGLTLLGMTATLFKKLVIESDN
jgi:hypothetical protein